MDLGPTALMSVKILTFSINMTFTLSGDVMVLEELTVIKMLLISKSAS